MSRLTLGAYWKARREPVERCADRLVAFMSAIPKFDDAFVNWYRLGRSRKDALRQKLDTQNRQELLTLLATGRNRRDTDKEIIEDLGFGVWLWNGETDREAGFNVTCGLYSEAPGLCNNVVLKFPAELARLADSAVAMKLLSAAVISWEPDWAGIFSNEAMNNRDWDRKPFVDWMVYVPQRIASVPSPSTVAHLENGGSVIVVQPNPPSVDNPEDQERIRRIEQVVRP